MSNQDRSQERGGSGGNFVTVLALLAFFTLANEVLTPRRRNGRERLIEKPLREASQSFVSSARLSFFKAHFAEPVPAHALADVLVFRHLDTQRPIGMVPYGVAEGRGPQEMVREAMFIVDRDAYPHIVCGLQLGYLTGECLSVQSRVGPLTPLRIQEVTDSVIGYEEG